VDAVISFPSSNLFQYVEALELIVLFADSRLIMPRDEFASRLPSDARSAFLELMAAWDEVNARRIAQEAAEQPDSPEVA
jgi:hypothetical protein